MPAVTADARLEVCGVVARVQHIVVVVAFEVRGVHGFEQRCKSVVGMPQISEHAEPFPIVLNHERHTIGRIVRGTRCVN